MSDIRDAVKNIMEADPFQGAEPEDIQKRKDAKKAAKQKEWEKWAEETGEDIIICPHCGANLLDEDDGGISTRDEVIEYSDYVYDKKYGNWEFVDSQSDSREVLEANCAQCGNELDMEELGIEI